MSATYTRAAQTRAAQHRKDGRTVASAKGSTGRFRVVGRLQREGSTWSIVSRDKSLIVHPKWGHRGQVQHRLLLWFVEPVGDRYEAIPASAQPADVVAAQPDGRLPAGLRAERRPRQPRKKPQNTGGRRALPPESEANYMRGRKIDLGRMPPRGPRFISGGLPGLGRRR